MKSVLKTLSSLALALGFSGAVMAVPISGKIDFVGSHTVSSSNLTTANLAIGIVGMTTSPFTASTGSFAPIPLGAAATSTSGFLANQAGNVVTSNSPTIWSVGGFAFSITGGSIFEVSNTTSTIEFYALGTITGAGWDPTPGVWVGTFNAFGATGTFSASSVVPDGGSTAAILGLALLGLAWFSKRKA